MHDIIVCGNSLFCFRWRCLKLHFRFRRGALSPLASVTSSRVRYFGRCSLNAPDDSEVRGGSEGRYFEAEKIGNYLTMPRLLEESLADHFSETFHESVVVCVISYKSSTRAKTPRLGDLVFVSKRVANTRILRRYFRLDGESGDGNPCCYALGPSVVQRTLLPVEAGDQSIRAFVRPSISAPG